MLSNQELEDLLQIGERDRVEFTESIRDLDKIREAICNLSRKLVEHIPPEEIDEEIKVVLDKIADVAQPK